MNRIGRIFDTASHSKNIWVGNLSFLDPGGVPKAARGASEAENHEKIIKKTKNHDFSKHLESNFPDA